MNGGFRALVIDDDEFSRTTAVRILRRLGAADVQEASDGAGAIALAGRPSAEIDLVLCDLRMPQLDGIDTLESLAALSRSARFVLASSVEPRLLRAAASSVERAGVASLHVMNKPVTVSKLRDVVAAMVLPFERSAPTYVPKDFAFSADEIRRGLARGEFTAFYQPRVSTTDRRVCGAEALIRWHHPDHGLLPAGAFIGVAQAGGLLVDMFDVVLPAAIEQCARWHRAGFPIGVSVNLPTSIGAARDLPNQLVALSARYRLSPDRVTFEVTEDGWLQEQDLSREVLTRLRVRGFGLAIDDFGTGYSGMQQLLNAPFNELKIDGSFIRAAPHDREASIAFRSIVALARQLELRIVAEGVETEAEWHLAADAGCHEVQGFLISRPVPADQFNLWLEQHAAQNVRAVGAG